MRRVEDNFVVTVVGVQGRDDSAKGVVEHCGADARVGHIGFGLVQVGRTEERLELSDGLAFVVEDGASGADPFVGPLSLAP